MNFSVNDIFSRKLQEIESRVPVKFSRPTVDSTFDLYLHAASEKVSSTVPMMNGHGTATAKKTSPAYLQNPALLNTVIESNIKKSASKYGLDPNLIRAVMKQESNFNPEALSKAGAQGLMQIMPDTAKILGLDDPWDIAQNIDGGARFLRDQLDRFGGDLRLGLAAYNAGPNNVIKYRGIPPFRETRDYIVKVLENYRNYSAKK